MWEIMLLIYTVTAITMFLSIQDTYRLGIALRNKYETWMDWVLVLTPIFNAILIIGITLNIERHHANKGKL